MNLNIDKDWLLANSEDDDGNYSVGGLLIRAAEAATILHADLVSALGEKGIAVLEGEYWSCDYLCRHNDLYLTWDVADNGKVLFLHSTPYSGQAMASLPKIDRARISCHYTIEEAVGALSNEIPSGCPLENYWKTLSEAVEGF